MTPVESAAEAVKDRLMSAAKALDTGSWRDAVGHLESMPVAIAEQPTRLVALALWKRIVLSNSGLSELGIDDPAGAATALGRIGQALENDGFMLWPKHAIPPLENEVGSRIAADIAATVLWERMLEAHPGTFEAVFELFQRGGNNERSAAAWQQFAERRHDYVPGYWNFLHFTKMICGAGDVDPGSLARERLMAIGREDLLPLADVYLLQMRQADPELIFEKAVQLADQVHRSRVVEYASGLGFMPEDLQYAVSAVRELATDNPAGAVQYMMARLANAEGRWADVLKLTQGELAGSFHHSGECLRANALAHQGRIEEARKELAGVTGDEASDKYLKARAAFVSVTVDLLDKGLALPRQGALPELTEPVGRPLAQSLWVGRKLRWIERLSIKSYLDNGWRFQLYVYDQPDNVPDGCEVLDASAIIPQGEVFTEGFGSGLHAGSVGAFSDLFRYRLLQTRGGLWTDTDVINFRRYDADGRKFISTEISDAGFVTLNGAIMAAPAGDAFVARAYERACEILHSDEMFFTRIGPYLLAELVVEAGVDTVELMPPDFLSRVFWMNTAMLLKPYDSVMRNPVMQNLVNLHVYTEMWRLLGLGLDKPPGPDTFIGRLYAEHFSEGGVISEDTAA